MRMLRDNPEWSNDRLVEEYIDRHYPDLARSTLERYARRVRWTHEIAEERAEEERAKMHDEITELRERLDELESDYEDTAETVEEIDDQYVDAQEARAAAVIITGCYHAILDNEGDVRKAYRDAWREAAGAGQSGGRGAKVRIYGNFSGGGSRREHVNVGFEGFSPKMVRAMRSFLQKAGVDYKVSTGKRIFDHLRADIDY